MGVLDSLFSRFRPPSMDDPTFGRLLYMDVPRNPSRSYWEAEWLFPPTGTVVSIGLPGGKDGPLAESRAFFESLVPRFDAIVEMARPGLERVFREWYERPLGEPLWDEVKLAGFGLEDPRATPLEWDVAFEAISGRWLGITVPFVGNDAQEPVVDT